MFVNITPSCYANVFLIMIVLVVSGFEQPVYSVSEEDGSITLCANLASPEVQRSATVTFQTNPIPNSAICE